MFRAINTTFAKTTIAIAATVVVGIAISSAPASAKGRQYEVQDYQFKRATHGYEGQANGGYFCSYVRIPKRVCRGSRCKVRGWTLRQECR